MQMRTEIMVTGLVIFGITVVVLVTAYIRHRIPYELFYIPHLLTLMMYLVACIHTLDDKVREEGTLRSQTGLWFGWSIAVYACDRLYRVLSTHWSLPITSIDTISDSSAVILRVARPPGFKFQPGHYVSLNIPMLGRMWHPFSIGSAPSDPELVFLIETKGEGSWTNALRSDKFLSAFDARVTRQLTKAARVRRFSMAPKRASMMSASSDVGWFGSLLATLGDRRGQAGARPAPLRLHVRGPFGTPLAATGGYDTTLAIGTGTGMVPLFGAMLKRCKLLESLGRDVLLNTRLVRLAHATSMAAQARYWGSYNATGAVGINEVDMAMTVVQLRWRLRSLKRFGKRSAHSRHRLRQAKIEGRHTLIRAALVVPIALEIATMGLAYSWTELPGYPTESMATALCAMTTSCVALYALHLVYRVCVPSRFPRTIVLALDVLITMSMVLYVVLACVGDQFQDLSVRMQLLGGTLAIWRLVRYYAASGAWPTWSSANLMHPSTWLLKTECEHYIWVCRSADLMMGGLPTIIDMARRTEVAFTRMGLSSGWLSHLFRVTLYCTDPDPGRTARLAEYVKGTNIDLRVVRPDIRTIVHDLVMEQLTESLTQEFSFPLRVAVSVAGNQKFSRESHRAVMDINAAMHSVGPDLVHCNFIPEFYDDSGGTASKAKRQ